MFFVRTIDKCKSWNLLGHCVHVGDVVGHSMDEPFVHRGIIVEYAVDVVGYYLNVADILVNVVNKLRTV